MAENIRSFIAIELSADIKDEFAKVQDALKTSNADVKWTKPSSMHLTLKFLGDVPKEKMGVIKTALDSIAPRHSAFAITLFKIGGFPALSNPRVIWVGIDKGCAGVEKIAADIDAELSKAGFAKEERAFSAHLTLGRVRSPKGRSALLSKIRTFDFRPNASSLVDRLILFQSTLTPQGSIYTVLHEANLS